MTHSRTLSLSLPLVLAALAALAPSMPAQDVGGAWTKHRQILGANADDHLGDAIASAGDVDGDGLDDLLIGAPTFDEAGAVNSGAVFVRSGSDGVLLDRYKGEASSDAFGHAVANAGDVNGDGFDDHLVGAPFHDVGIWANAGKAYLLSGADGSLLRAFQGTEDAMQLGWDVAGIGDVNGDGCADIAIATQESEAGKSLVGSVFVHSGRNGAQLYKLDGDTNFERFGMAVTGLGDVTGDGVGDLAIGAPFYDTATFFDAGSVSIYSGADGALWHRLEGTENSMLFGWDVADAGDVDADGGPDLIVGTVERTGSPGQIQAGSAKVFVSGSWTQLYHWDGATAQDNFGWSVDGAGDVDDDGHADLIVGAPGEDSGGSETGAAYVFSGAAGDLLFRIEGNTNSKDAMGDCVAGVGDTDGDGRVDVAIGAPGAIRNGNDDAGELRVYALDPFVHASATQLSASSGEDLVLAVDFPATEAGYAYILLASGSGIGPSSFGGIELPLVQDAVFSLMIGPNPPALFVQARGTLDFQGDATVTMLSDAALLPFVGALYRAAVVSYDPFTLSGRRVTIARAVRIVG